MIDVLPNPDDVSEVLDPSIGALLVNIGGDHNNLTPLLGTPRRESACLAP